MALEQPEEPAAYEHNVGDGVFGVGKALNVDALRAQNTLLRALLDEANKKERHATASFNAAKLANAFLSNRMGKLELELTEFAAEVAKSSNNDGDGGGVGSGERGGDADNDAGGDNAAATAEAMSAELEAVRARLARAEEELMSTRRALAIVVNAFGRDAVVDKLQDVTERGRESADGGTAKHRKHHDKDVHSGQGRHGGGGGKAARATGSTAEERADGSRHHKSHHHPHHDSHNGAGHHKHHGGHGTSSPSEDVVVPAFIREAIVQGNGVARSARVAAAVAGHAGRGHGRRGHAAAPVTSPFASPPPTQADEFRALHPLVPLQPNPVPVTDFLAEFRRGGAGSGAATTKSPVRGTVGRSPGAAAYTPAPGGGGGSGGMQGGINGGGAVSGSGRSSAGERRAGAASSGGASAGAGPAAQDAANAVSSYVRMASPGSRQAPNQELRQQVSAEVGSFIANFRSRVPASPPKHAPPPLPAGSHTQQRGNGNASGQGPSRAHPRRDRGSPDLAPRAAVAQSPSGARASTSAAARPVATSSRRAHVAPDV